MVIGKLGVKIYVGGTTLLDYWPWEAILNYTMTLQSADSTDMELFMIIVNDTGQFTFECESARAIEAAFNDCMTHLQPRKPRKKPSLSPAPPSESEPLTTAPANQKRQQRKRVRSKARSFVVFTWEDPLNTLPEEVKLEIDSTGICFASVQRLVSESESSSNV
jgi:hypothetical protein